MSSRSVPGLSLLIAWLLLALALALNVAPAGAAPPADPNCGGAVPAATDGHMELDRAAVRPGEPALGVLTNFRQWPIRLIGGGSGETFLSCTPWLPGAEVMIHDAAGLFLMPVPIGTKPGTYQVSVRFYEGGISALRGGRKVQLTAALTVSAEPPATTEVSAACRLNHTTAKTGVLEAPTTVHAGTTLPVSVTGVAHTVVLNEYDRLFFVACLAGRATAVTFPGGLEVNPPSLSFSVHVPPGLPAGTYDLAVTGTLPDVGIVSWHRIVVVQQSPVLAVTGTVGSLAVTVGAGLVATGGLLLFFGARRRRPTPCRTQHSPR
jgi:hypothetical protein